MMRFIPRGNPMKKVASKVSEHAVQAAFITWARLQKAWIPALENIFAIPNGAFLGGDKKMLRSGRTVSMAAIRMNRLKGEGLKPGVPDVMLAWPAAGFHGLFLEFKRPKGGKHSDGQKEWRARLEKAGYAYASPRTLDEGVLAVKQYLGVKG